MSDLFESRGDKVASTSPGEHDIYDRSQLGRTVLLGFSYRLGGADGTKPQDVRFTY